MMARARAAASSSRAARATSVRCGLVGGVGAALRGRRTVVRTQGRRPRIREGGGVEGGGWGEGVSIGRRRRGQGAALRMRTSAGAIGSGADPVAGDVDPAALVAPPGGAHVLVTVAADLPPAGA